MALRPIPQCPTCKGITTFGSIPDSLAVYCHNCGFVWVSSSKSPTGWEAGATLQQWAADIYESKK